MDILFYLDLKTKFDKQLPKKDSPSTFTEKKLSGVETTKNFRMFVPKAIQLTYFLKSASNLETKKTAWLYIK